MGLKRKSMKISFSRILVLAPHTDDAELGAGGVIAKAVAEGAQVTSVAFSDCRESVPPGFDPLVLRKEVVAAHGHLGVSDVRVLDFKVRHFPQNRQEILDSMLELRKELQPDLVLVPMRSDIHQDHETISREALRAFKHATIWGYECPWNNLTLDNALLIALTEEQLAQKVQAVAAYASQGFRSYANELTIRSLATIRGVQMGVPLAESFEVIRWCVRS